MLALVDSGATKSAMSEEAAARVTDGQAPSETDVREVWMANGSSVPVKGAMAVEMELAGQQVREDVLVVADIEYELVLGLDLLWKHGGSLDLVSHTLRWDGKHHPVEYRRDKPGACRVRLAERTEVRPGVEQMVRGVLDGRGSANEGCAGMLETATAEDGLLVARALVRPSGSQVWLRICNPTSQTVRVPRGETAAWFRPLEPSETVRGPAEERTEQDEVSDKSRELLECIGEWGAAATSEAEEARFRELVKSFADVFATDASQLGATSLVEHEIQTGDAEPTRVPPRRLSPHLRPEVFAQIDELHRQGLIEEAQSPWNAPIVCVRKKDGSLRLCVDYRELNRVTVRDAIPLPRMDDALDELAGARVFSTMDLHSGYWQVKVKEEDQPKTAFSVPQRGQFVWKRMPFGLVNSPATFTRLMAAALDKVAWKICLIYLDDVLVWSRTVDEHLQRLQQIFELMREAGVRLKPQKCHFLMKRVSFLGHVVSEAGVETESDKVEAVKSWPKPESKKDIQAFMGLCGYYRRFLRDFSVVAEPLTRLTRKDEAFRWDAAEQEAFDELKRRLTSTEVMAFPDFNPGAGEFVLDTDASSAVGIGAVLSQKQPDGTEKVIAYASRGLNAAERNYCTTRLELLAIVHFTAKFKYYLLGRKFLLRTDHSSLQWLHNLKDAEGQCARWLEKLADFHYDVQHRKGVLHGNADGLSRRPTRRHAGFLTCPSCEQLPMSSRVELNAVATVGSERQRLRRAQEQEPMLTVAKQMLDGGPSEALNATALGRHLLAERDRLHVLEGLLVRRHQGRDQVVLPEEMLKEVVLELHAGVAGGHFGWAKSLRRVQERFWRPGLGRAVRQAIGSCETCAKAKLARKRRAPLKPIQTDGPMERVMVDIVGPLPRSHRGNVYLLTMQDAFTKWPEAVPIRNQRAPTVARAILDRWVSCHGCPRALHSDQGRNFESKVVKELCQLMRIRKTRTTAYHPAGNGQVERLNQTLKAVLKCCLAEDAGGRDWEDFVQPALMAYRSSVHRGTGETPYCLMYGREMQLPLDVAYRLPAEAVEASEFAANLHERMQRAFEEVRRRMATYQKAQKAWHDQRAQRACHREGDRVFVFAPGRKLHEASKFHVAWAGPYEIVRRVDERLYDVKLVANPRKRKRVHAENLAPCPNPAPDTLPAAEQQSGETDDVDEEEETEVGARTPETAPQQQVEDAESASTHSSSAADSFVSVEAGQEEVERRVVEVEVEGREAERRYPVRVRRPVERFVAE
jgi:transposase InsO family protein